ncbi:MAG: ribosome biogenesis GTPase Der [Chloroflexota bacterium]
MARPIVAIVGRPNVGKSTLFNRVVGHRMAIVEDIPGTTRDRLYGDALWNGRDFVVVDTGGMAAGLADELGLRVQAQARLAVEEADIIVFVGDAVEGVTAADAEVADLLRRAAKPVLLAANKAETKESKLDIVGFYSLGLGDPLMISAIHGQGVADLLDEVVDRLPAEDESEETPEMPHVAIIGRPNVGKSSIVNALIGQERVIVDDVPGTTRDAIDTLIDHNGQPMLLIDTAGMRRRGRIEVGVEKYSVMRALRALSRADVALLVIDADEGVTAQDAHVGSYVVDAGKAVVLVVNKWDLVPKQNNTMAEYMRIVRDRFKFLDFAPVVFVSAVTHQRLSQMLDAAVRVYAERQKRIPTAKLNQVVSEAEAAHTPPSAHGRHLKINYATQAETSPPTFVFFVNDPKLVHFSYERFLENRLREAFGFEGAPLRLVFRGRGEDKREG